MIIGWAIDRLCLASRLIICCCYLDRRDMGSADNIFYCPTRAVRVQQKHRIPMAQCSNGDTSHVGNCTFSPDYAQLSQRDRAPHTSCRSRYIVDCCTSVRHWPTYGDAENARHEIAGHENAAPECKGGKCET